MARYHNSPNGPRLCKAEKGLCPYGRAGEEHFETQAEAQVAYEAKMADAFGGLETVKKTASERGRQATYQKRDALVAQAKLVKASAPVQNTVAALRAIKETPQRVEASLRRAEERVQARADQAAVATEAFVKAMGPKLKELSSDYKTQYQALNSLGTSPSTPKLKAGKASGLLPGDKLADGGTVRSVLISGDTVTVHVRRANGTLGQKNTYSMSEKIPYQRVTKRQSRGSAFAGRAQQKLNDSPLYQRVQAASDLQRQAFHTLRGADMEQVAARKQARREARSAWRTRALGRMKGFAQRASTTQQKAVNGLLAVHATNTVRASRAAA